MFLSRIACILDTNRAISIIAVLLLLLNFYFCFIHYPVTEGFKSDFYHSLGNRELHGRIAWNGEGVYYSPVHTLIDLLFSRLSDDVILSLFYIIDLTLLSLTILLLVKTFFHTGIKFVELLLLLFICLNFYPVQQLIRGLYIETIELFFISLAIYLYDRKRFIRSAVAFGLAASTKLLPAIFIPVFILKRKYRESATIFSTWLLFMIVISRVKGLSAIEGVREFILPQQSGFHWTRTYHKNQAISGFIFRLFSEKNFATIRDINIPTIRHETLCTILTGISVLIVVSTVVFIIRSKKNFTYMGFEIDLKSNLEFSLVLIIMILVIPYNLPHYIALILPGIVLGLFLLFRVNRSRNSILVFLYIFGILLNVLIPLRILEGFWKPTPVGNIELAKALSMPFLGTLCLFIMLIWFFSRFAQK